MAGKRRGRARLSGERYPSGDRKKPNTRGEPIAPGYWARIKTDAAKGVIDARCGTEVGRLSYHSELTTTQAAAAFRIGEIYGRYERLKGKRRSSASPSYQSGSRGEAGLAEELMDAKELERYEAGIIKAEQEFYALTGRLPNPDAPLERRQAREGAEGQIPRRLLGPIEELCVEDKAINPMLLDDIRDLLDRLAFYFGISNKTGGKTSTMRGRKKPGEPAAVVSAPRPNIDRIYWMEVLRRVLPKLNDRELAQIYDTQQAIKARAIFRLKKSQRPKLVVSNS